MPVYVTGGLTSLERLSAAFCRSLVSLPASLGGMGRLGVLDVRWCDALTSLPASLGGASRLVQLHLANCSNLMQLPESICSLGGACYFKISCGCTLLCQCHAACMRPPDA